MIQTENGPQKLTYEAVQARKKRRETTHVVNTDDDAVKALRAAEATLQRAKLVSSSDDVAKAQTTYNEAETAVRDAALVFRLRALPRQGDGSFAVLQAEHPPTAEDNQRIQDSSGDPKAKAIWHTKTFAPALVAATLIEPEVTPEQVAAWAEGPEAWNDAEWDGLYYAALDVNRAATDTGGLTFS